MKLKTCSLYIVVHVYMNKAIIVNIAREKVVFLLLSSHPLPERHDRPGREFTPLGFQFHETIGSDQRGKVP